MQITDYYPDEIPEGIAAMLTLVGQEPSLRSMWALMDMVWFATGANSGQEQRVADFYAHPVWTLNGIFTETHADSVYNREVFSSYIASRNPTRIADYGGGFGALARILAKKLPNASIEIVEPYPSPLALELAAKFDNVTYVDSLTNKYDCIVALDVLEHVSTPLDLAYSLASHTEKQGFMLLANCFYPVIHCHLPETFYLRNSFDFLLKKMGIVSDEHVLYGTTYSIKGCFQPPTSIKIWILMAKLYHESKQMLNAGKVAIRNSIASFKALLA